MPPLTIDSDAFIGFNPDGSFALALRREIPAQSDVPGVQNDPLVGYFTPSGELIGVARRRPAYIYLGFNHDLAHSPDGSVYQLITNPDHSVQIIRLGFRPDVASLPQPDEISNSPIPTKASPRLPRWEKPPAGASEQEIARETLVRFFTWLDQRRYREAADLYGGDFSEVSLERLTDEDDAAYWERLCSINIMCMPVLEIVAEEALRDDEYRFFVEFLWFDGTRFVNGPCCGASPAEQPGYWQFAYPVKKIDGQWKVMRAPLFVP
jgi:hypothetical protein